MGAVEQVDVRDHVLDIRRNLSMQPRARQPGPPERIDGMTFGVVTMSGQAPHNGEMHPDGDELLYVISGRMRITYDSGDTQLDLSAGQACIVRKGEWHKVECLETTQFIHLTPGPRGEARLN